MALIGLGEHFHTGELCLLLGIAAIRRIPIAIIFELATGVPGDTPVGNLVQGTAKVILCIADSVRAAERVHRLQCAPYQHRGVVVEKSRAKRASRSALRCTFVVLCGMVAALLRPCVSLIRFVTPMSSRRRNCRPAHARPAILGGQLVQTANGFVDTMMAGRVSANDLAAVAVGASIWVPLFLFMTGVLMSATPILSRHLGGEAYHRIQPLAQQGLWLALGLGVLCALILRSVAPVMVWMDTDPAIRPMVSGYLDALSWGMPGAAIMLALRSYTEAMNHTRPVLVFSVIGLLINIPNNYVLIYGKLGFPAMGGVGCGWATSLVMWCMALMMLVYTHRHQFAGAPLNLRQRHLKCRVWATCVWACLWACRFSLRSASLP